VEADDKGLPVSYPRNVAATIIWIAIVAIRTLSALGLYLAFCPEPNALPCIKRRLFVRRSARENLPGQFVADRVAEQARLAVPIKAHP
jgi:hypothetical protein